MIRVGFGHGLSFMSRLAMWVTKSKWSHVWIEYPSNIWGGDWVAHSSFGRGVIIEPIGLVYGRMSGVRLFETNSNITVGMSLSKSLFGLGYDYWVIWNALMMLLHRFTRWKFLWRYVKRDSSRITCSEFVALILKRSGMQYSMLLDPEFVTPADLFALCEHSEDFKMVG